MRQLIVIADDFGASSAVNAAVAAAHRDGVLTTASLLVNAPACEEAIAIARATPALAVGLHLALSRSRATLARERIPHLVDRNGRFPDSSAWAGIRYQFARVLRTELEDEIRAQLERFAATGLPLDHVTGHQHIHMHPRVLDIVLRCAAEFRIPALRVVRDDLRRNFRLDRRRIGYKLVHWLMFAPLGRRGARCVRAAGLTAADRVWGLYQDGRMTRDHLLALLRDLPPGITEIYAHPSTADDMDRTRQPRAELAALVDPAVRAAVTGGDIALTTYGFLARARC